MKRLACAVAVVAGAGAILSGTALTASAEPIRVAIPGSLQIAIETPTTNSGSSVNLDVTFRGGDMRSIELYLNGDLIKKQAIRTKEGKGVVSFALDGLSVGSHDVLIKAYDLHGNVATATTRLKVSGEEFDGLAQFITPLKQNAAVQGIVPLQVKVDKSVKNPYVTFVIGDDFAFINLPPFTYNWDSTKVANGYQTVNVEIIDGDTLAKVKTLTLILNVKNPGGYTNRERDIRDLSGKNNGLPLESVARRAAESVMPKTTLDHQSVGGLLSRLDTDFVPSVRGSRHPLGKVNNTVPAPTLQNFVMGADMTLQTPGTLASRDASTYIPTPRNTVPNNGLANPTVHPLPPTHDVRPSLDSPRPDIAGLLAMPNMVSDISRPTAGIARQGVRLRRSGNIAAMPQTALGNVSMAVKSTVATVPAAPKKIARNTVSVSGMKVNGKAIEVAFDNQRIAFDVSPRIEKGIPLAPFRQIFEHTGGKVEWYQKSQTVRAFNSEREVEFRVGDKQAKVNNRAVTIERKPYIERGRAIVPLSFVRDAMNVKVNFDAATGRLMIQSNK